MLNWNRKLFSFRFVETQLAGSILSFLATFYPCVTLAEISCLDGVSGGSVVWNPEWQEDRQDNQVIYSIDSVVHIRSLSAHAVQLDLSTRQPAAKTQRLFVVASDEVADKVCSQIQAATGPSVRNEQTVSTLTMPRVREEYSRFIRYSRIGWVRSDPPQSGNFDTCRALGQNFQCLKEEKARYGQMLKDLEEEKRFSERY